MNVETTAKLTRQDFNKSANPFPVASLCINQGCGLTFGQAWILSIYPKHKGTVATIYELWQKWIDCLLGARTRF